LTRMDRMFDGATRFKQNLCRWIPLLRQDVTCFNMFDGTSCSSKPNVCHDAARSDSFCESCLAEGPNQLKRIVDA